MKDWFTGLEPRERLLVAGGGVILVLLAFYLMVVEPISSSYRNLKDGVAEQKQTLAWMKQAAGQIQTLQRSGAGRTSGLGGRSLLAVVDQSARNGGLGAAIKRIEPEGGKGVKVWLESAPFDPMILWLGRLAKSHQVKPSMITLEPLGGGLVNARLTLLEPGV